MASRTSIPLLTITEYLGAPFRFFRAKRLHGYHSAEEAIRAGLAEFREYDVVVFTDRSVLARSVIKPRIWYCAGECPTPSATRFASADGKVVRYFIDSSDGILPMHAFSACAMESYRDFILNFPTEYGLHGVFVPPHYRHQFGFLDEIVSFSQFRGTRVEGGYVTRLEDDRPEAESDPDEADLFDWAETRIRFAEAYPNQTRTLVIF